MDTKKEKSLGQMIWDVMPIVYQAGWFLAAFFSWDNLVKQWIFGIGLSRQDELIYVLVGAIGFTTALVPIFGKKAQRAVLLMWVLIGIAGNTVLDYLFSVKHESLLVTLTPPVLCLITMAWFSKWVWEYIREEMGKRYHYPLE